MKSASRRKADVSCKMWNRWKTWRANGWTDRFWCRRSQTSLQGRAEGWSWVDVGRVFLEVELGCASKELQVVQNHDYRYYNPGIHCVYDKPHVSHVPRLIFNGCPVSRSYEFLGGWWGCTSKKGLPIWTKPWLAGHVFFHPILGEMNGDPYPNGFPVLKHGNGGFHQSMLFPFTCPFFLMSFFFLNPLVN